MELIIANLSRKVRRDTLYGRPHLVANGTLIVPGVLNGSMGPLFYPQEEVANSPESWNGMPLLVYHPQKQGSSARTSSTLNEQGVGTLLNVRYDEALKGEFWFDEERTQLVSPPVYDALVNGQKIEISTGLKVTQEKAAENSQYNGTEYVAIARNFKPDHVAILPDQVGACSLKDGCGVNNQNKVNDANGNTENELSQDDVRSALSVQLVERYPNQDAWPVDVFQSYVVFKKNDGLFKLGYTSSTKEVKLSDDDPVEVKRVTTYELVSNQDGPGGSSDLTQREGEPTMAENAMKPEEKKQLIDGLIKNSCCWDEEDRKELEAMTDNQLKRTKESADKAAENEQLLQAAEAGFNDDRDEVSFNREKREWTRNKKKEEPVANQQPALTPEQQEALNYGTRKLKEDKDAVINRLAGDDKAKAAFLQNKSMDELQQIASLIPAQNSYGPNATQNRRQEIDREDHLVAPDIDWTANSAFAKKS